MGRPPTAKKNCRTTSETAPITVKIHLLIVLLRNKYFVFILSWIYMCYMKLKNMSISYSRDVCHHINCRRPTKDSFLSVPFDPLQPHVPWAFPKFNKDEKLKKLKKRDKNCLSGASVCHAEGRPEPH